MYEIKSFFLGFWNLSSPCYWFWTYSYICISTCLWNYKFIMDRLIAGCYCCSLLTLNINNRIFIKVVIVVSIFVDLWRWHMLSLDNSSFDYFFLNFYTSRLRLAELDNSRLVESILIPLLQFFLFPSNHFLIGGTGRNTNSHDNNIHFL